MINQGQLKNSTDKAFQNCFINTTKDALQFLKPPGSCVPETSPTIMPYTNLPKPGVKEALHFLKNTDVLNSIAVVIFAIPFPPKDTFHSYNNFTNYCIAGPVNSTEKFCIECVTYPKKK